MGQYTKLVKEILFEERLPKNLFHGTSFSNLLKIKENNWNVKDLYLADVEEKSWDYASKQVDKDGSYGVVIILNSQYLDKKNITIDRGSNEEEYQYDMGQYLYSGNIQKAIIDIKSLDENVEKEFWK